MASDVTEIRDEDELEVYGNEVQTSVQLSSYSFEVNNVTTNVLRRTILVNKLYLPNVSSS